MGRQGEIARVRAALAETKRSGRATVVEMVGDPGIGKSSLLAAALAEAENAGMATVSAKATHGGVPFGALGEALGDLVAEREWRPGDDRAALAEIFPELREFRVERAQRDRIHRAMRGLLEKVSSQGLVLALDDMHWADSALVELLSYLVRQPPRTRVLIVMAYRPRQVDPRLTAALASGAVVVHRLELTPLCRNGVRELLGPDVGRTRVAALHETSGGNPFYLRALAASDLPAGTGLTAVLLAELAGLSPVSQQVVRAAAVLGNPFDPELVAAVAGLDQADASSALDEAHQRDLVRPHGMSRFAFRHDVLRQVIYDSSAASWRRDAHMRASKAMQRRGDGLPTVAGHVARSAVVGDWDAIALLRQAADELHWHAPGVAATMLREALRLLPVDGRDGAEHHELQIRLARCIAADGRLHDARSVIQELLHHLPPGERPAVVALAAMIERMLGHHTRARALVRRELETVREPLDAAGLELELGTTGMLAGDFAADRELIEKAYRTACRFDDLPLRARGAALIALADFTCGAIGPAAEWADTAAFVVDSLADRTLTVSLETTVHLGWVEVFLERFDTALGHLERGLRLARRSGQDLLLPFLLGGIACAYQWLGRLDTAARFAEDAVVTAELSGSDELRTVTYALQALVANRQGDVELARRIGERATTAAGRERDWWSATAAMIHGEARLYAGDDPAECLRTMVDAVGGPDLDAIDPGHRPNWYQTFFYAQLAAGHADAARSWLERMAACLDTALPCRAALVQLAEGHLLLHLGQSDLALDRARAAAPVFTAAGNELDLGRAHLLAGLALTATGQRADARIELDRARATFAACSAHRLHDEATRALRQLGHRVPGRKPATDALTPLTERETQIAALIAEGLTNAQIARRLVLSIRTIDAHLRNIFTKLGVTSRAAVAAHTTRREVA